MIAAAAWVSAASLLSVKCRPLASVMSTQNEPWGAGDAAEMARLRVTASGQQIGKNGPIAMLQRAARSKNSTAPTKLAAGEPAVARVPVAAASRFGAAWTRVSARPAAARSCGPGGHRPRRGPCGRLPGHFDDRANRRWQQGWASQAAASALMARERTRRDPCGCGERRCQARLLDTFRGNRGDVPEGATPPRPRPPRLHLARRRAQPRRDPSRSIRAGSGVAASFC